MSTADHRDLVIETLADEGADLRALVAELLADLQATRELARAAIAQLGDALQTNRRLRATAQRQTEVIRTYLENRAAGRAA